MTISTKIAEYLQTAGVDYEVIEHPEAFTAQAAAEAQHTPGKEVLKVVVVKADNKYLMCVLSADHRLDFEKLKEILGTDEVTLATEEETETLFPYYDQGAEPPLGNLHGLEVYFDNYLQERDAVFFKAGTHVDSIKMKYSDLEELVGPRFGDFSQRLS
ncbi:MAG: aminoacyl-tRNA deacylase [Chlamydiota bacterium]